MKTQNDIAKVLGYSQPTIHLILTGKRAVSWPIADRMAELFPGRTIKQWKKATPEEIKRAFSQLKIDDVA